MVLKSPSVVALQMSWLWTLIVKVSWVQSFKLFCKETKLQVNMMVLVARWSWKGCSLVTLGKPRLYAFTVHISWERASSWNCSFSWRMVLKGHSSVTLGKPQLCTFTVQVSGRQKFESFPLETELWVVLLWDRASSWYDNFSGRMYLRRLFISDPGEV